MTNENLKVFMFVSMKEAHDFGEKPEGARVMILAYDEPEARRLLEGVLPRGLDVNTLLFKKAMLDSTPQVFAAKNFVALDLTNGYKTSSFIQGDKLS